MDLDFWLRLLTITIFVIVRVYWYKAKYKSNLEKHKVQIRFLTIEKFGIILGVFTIAISLLGFTIFTFQNTILQLFGFVLVIIGCFEVVSGRLVLGSNWTEVYEYQIKAKHELIIHGIYHFVRHPIYGGSMILVTGAFMVAKTYLFIPIFLFLLVMMVKFAKREEDLLICYFGRKYTVYMRKTKMLIPFLI